MYSQNIVLFHESPAIRLPGYAPDCEILIGSGAIEVLPQVLRKRNAGKVFVLSDVNTRRAAGENACRILAAGDIAVSEFSFPQEKLEPDESSVGLAVMHFDPTCDAILGVGSGVINDIGKILASISGKPYIILATAPSMDGYASATSSMTRGGLKVSLPSKCPDVIVGDTEILRNAPMKLLVSGLGDMLAKYVSICEWRISQLINGEYYHEEIAAMVRLALGKCVENAPGLLRRDGAAAAAVFEGLAICGMAMKYAGLSRPASGMEHYISHVLDMRGAQFGTPTETHGLQCAMGTLISVRLYERLRTITPNREQALAYVGKFCFEDWCVRLRRLLGRGAEAMIAQEKKEGKYDRDRHAARLEIILEKWDALLAVMAEELPAAAGLEALLDRLGVPKTLQEIGTEEALLPEILYATRDIRDKYVLSRLLWDLGIPVETLLGGNDA